MAVQRASKLRDRSRCKLIIAFEAKYAANIVYNFIFGHNFLTHG